MKRTKEIRGITLIALVITIIVLLILAGVALATLTGNSSIIDNANYAYCSETGYYYYLSEPMYSQQRVIYTTTVDLLMTYKSEIKNLKCIIARQESKYNAYLNDDRLPVLNKQEVSILPFPGGFTHPSNDSILLVVNGR